MGKNIEIYSNSGYGKSTITLSVCRSLCKQGYRVLYIDAEGQSERGEIAANYIKTMINAMKRGYSPEEAWNYYLQNTSL